MAERARPEPLPEEPFFPQVQILPPLLEKPRKRGFSVLLIVIERANLAQVLPF
jgi:hypothetical protein